MSEIPSIDPVQQAKEAIVNAKTGLLKTFAFIPDEKLNWSPLPPARTPVWMVAHCGASNEVFAAILRGESVPMPSDPAEITAAIRAGGQTVTTRAEAVEMVEKSTEKLLAALDTVTPELFQSSPQSPVGQIPFVVWMRIPSDHMMAHTSQLEYLQTMWGDLEAHS